MKRWHKRVTQWYAMQRQCCDAMQHSNLAVPTRSSRPLPHSVHSFYVALLSSFFLASLTVHSIPRSRFARCTHTLTLSLSLSLSLSLHLSLLILSTFPLHHRCPDRREPVHQPPFLHHQTIVGHRRRTMSVMAHQVHGARIQFNRLRCSKS